MNNEIKKSEIITLFRESNDHFRTSLSLHSDINAGPFEGSWSMARVGDHILRSTTNLPGLLNGSNKSTGRNPEEKKEAIKKIFLDFSIKMKSPDFIIPGNGPFVREELLNRVDKNESAIVNAMQIHDLGLIYLDFELPGLGSFTGFEWIWFAIYHMKRHIHQIENIHRHLLQGNEQDKSSISHTV